MSTKYLDQKLVTDFATTRALERELFDWMDAARATMLGQLRSGSECPTAGPYLVVIEKSKQRVIDWQELYRQSAQESHQLQGKTPDEAFGIATQNVADIEKRAKKKTILRLTIKTNLAFEHDMAGKTLGQLQKVKYRKGRK